MSATEVSVGGEADLAGIRPDRVFDGGDLDCGSGLALLIRENVLQVPVGGVLEIRSREPTVGSDLPPWCRMVGHEYLGAVAAGDSVRHLVRRGEEAIGDDAGALAADGARARDYEWRTRVRATGPQRTTVYARTFRFDVGQPASFDETDAHPSAVEYVLGALGGALAAGLATECARDGLAVEDVELTVRGRLVDVLAHLGMADGDPGFAAIAVTCFVTTREEEPRVRAAWDRAVRRSPLAATLAKACALELRLAFA